VRAVLAKESLFAVLVECDLHELQLLEEVKMICAVSGSIPVLVYSIPVQQELLFELPKHGVHHFIPHPNTDLLMTKLHQLRDQADFRIDWNEFGIELRRCSCWTQRFLKLISCEQNYAKLLSVKAVADRLGIRVEHLNRVCKKDTDLTPKQLLLGVKIYHLLYQLQMRPACAAKEVMQRHGFQNEHAGYKSFRKATGMTINTFRKDRQYTDFPEIYLKIIDKKTEK